MRDFPFLRWQLDFVYRLERYAVVNDKGSRAEIGVGLDNRPAVFPADVVRRPLEGQALDYITLRAQIWKESAEATRVLKGNGIKNLLLTGDNERVAKSVSDQLGMDGFLANVLPHQKQEKVKELQALGELAKAYAFYVPVVLWLSPFWTRGRQASYGFV